VEILLYVYHCRRRALYVHAAREARQHLLGSRFTAEPCIQITQYFCHKGNKINGYKMSQMNSQNFDWAVEKSLSKGG
jgi:hypothetical protein